MTAQEVIVQRTNDAISKEVKVDRKTEVMSWLENLTHDDWDTWNSVSEVQNTAKAALELLKEQEPVNVVRRIEETEWNVCSNCGGHIISKWKWCPYCGREVKWS